MAEQRVADEEGVSQLPARSARRLTADDVLDALGDVCARLQAPLPRSLRDRVLPGVTESLDAGSTPQQALCGLGWWISEEKRFPSQVAERIQQAATHGPLEPTLTAEQLVAEGAARRMASAAGVSRGAVQALATRKGGQWWTAGRVSARDVRRAETEAALSAWVSEERRGA